MLFRSWIFLLSAIPVIILGFGELFLGWGGELVVGNTPIHIWGIVPGGNPQGRMASVFGYTNGLAEYLQMVFIFAMGLWIDTWEQEVTSRKLSFPQIWRTPKLIYLSVLLTVCGIALITTSSRSAWGGAIACTLIFAIYQSWYWLLGLVSTVMAIVFGAAYAPDPVKTHLRTIVPRYFWARITDEMYPDRPGAMTRVSQWKFAWKLTQDRPITGWGLQSFGKLYQAHSQLWLGHPHNIILMLSSNLGLPATIGLVGIVGWVLARATILFLEIGRAHV